MTVYCYIIQNDIGTFYTGITKNLHQRLITHNAGGCISTAKGNNWNYVWSIGFDGYITARKVENYIKKVGAKRFLNYKVARHPQQNKTAAH